MALPNENTREAAAVLEQTGLGAVIPLKIKEGIPFLGVCLGMQWTFDSSVEAKFERYVGGVRTPTGRDAVEWAGEPEDRGAGEILLTSMDRDGTGAASIAR